MDNENTEMREMIAMENTFCEQSHSLGSETVSYLINSSYNPLEMSKSSRESRIPNEMVRAK